MDSRKISVVFPMMQSRLGAKGSACAPSPAPHFQLGYPKLSRNISTSFHMSNPPQDLSTPAVLLHHRSSAFEHFTDGLMITTLDGRIIDWNAGATRMFGWTREEMLGRTPAVLHRECDAPALTDSINEAAARTGHWSGEIVFIRKDGSTGICETTTVPMRDADGNIFATLG